MKNRYAIIIAVVAALFLVLIVFLFLRMNRMEERYLRLLSERQVGQERGGDPYLRGPVKNTVTKHSKEILSCYDAFLARAKAGGDPALKKEGAVTLDWQVDGDGEVIAPAVVRADFTDKTFHACLVKTISAWRFPEPPFGEKRYVEHTFRFSEQKK